MLKGTVEIVKLRLHCHHGVASQERLVGNIFEVTVALDYDMENAAVSDDVASALDYSRVVTTVSEVMAIPSALLENVVLRLKERIMSDYPEVTGGYVKVAKVTPPIPGKMESVALSLRW